MRIGPAGRDDLRPGVEVHAVGTVHVSVAEQRVLPPAEREYATGTGIGTLMPTIPASTSYWNRRAAPPSRVKIAAPFP